MSGYEDLNPEQIIYLANMALAIVIVIMVGKVIPAILNYRATKYLSLKIESTKCEKQNNPKTAVKWLIEKCKDRKKKTENDYQPYYIPLK